MDHIQTLFRFQNEEKDGSSYHENVVFIGIFFSDNLLLGSPFL